jgi:NAD(P)-dependent dehydrogenase (short-subunit alcohol dehydrogenase family)
MCMQRASLQELLKQVLDRFGKVDVLVNCAGRTKRVPTLEMTDEDWSAILETNLTGTLRGCQVFAPPMTRARLRAGIVNIASLASFVGLLERGRLHGEQVRRGRADPRAGRRMGPEGRERQRDRAGGLPHRAEHGRCSTARAARSCSRARRSAATARSRSCRAPACSWRPSPPAS